MIPQSPHSLITKEFESYIREFQRDKLPYLHDFLNVFRDSCELLYDKTYMELHGFIFIHALDLCEIIDFATPDSQFGKSRSTFQNSVFSKLSIETILNRNINFTILPGTIYETLRFLIRLISNQKNVLNEIRGLKIFEEQIDVEKNLLNENEIKKIYKSFFSISQKFKFIDSLITSINIMINADGYVPINQLIKNVYKKSDTLGHRRYRRWYRWLSSFAEREHRKDSNIADAINLSIIPAINSNNAKTIVSLTTRTPSFYSKKSSKLDFSITQRFGKKRIPLFHKPSILVLSNLIDPYQSFSHDRYYEAVTELCKDANDIQKLTDKLSYKIGEIKEIRKSTKDLLPMIQNIGSRFIKSKVDIINEFYQLFLIDSDYALQIRNTNKSYEYSEPNLISNEVDRENKIAESLRLTEKIIDLGQRLSKDAGVNIHAASPHPNKTEFYILKKAPEKSNQLTEFGYGVFEFPPNNSQSYRRIEVYSTLVAKSHNLMFGINFLKDNWKNIYFRKSKPLAISIDKFFNSFKFDDGEEITAIGVFKNSSIEIVTFYFDKNNHINLLDSFSMLPLKTIQIETNHFIVTVEEENEFRHPYLSIRTNSKYTEKFLDFYETLNFKLPTPLVRLFLEQENLI